MTTVTKAMIASGLRRMSLGEGDIVLLHSSLASLGQVEGGADAVIDAFLEVLGEDGTLVVPTFGALGVITTTLAERDGAVQSIHPKASVAALGGAADAICRQHWKADLAHGPGTPYTRVADMGGYVCLLGVDQDRNTTLHTVEELLRLPYLTPTAEVTFQTPEGEVTRGWESFPGPHRDFIGIDRALREQGVVKVGHIGDATVRLMRSADLIEAGRALGDADPAFVLCDNPACRDCVRQRAAIRRDRFQRESFSVSAVSSLAGYYAEEMADQCLQAGIEALDIDTVRGLPIPALDRDDLAYAVGILRREGIEVRALRVMAVGDGMAAALEAAEDLGVPHVVLPLAEASVALADTAVGGEVSVSFQNRALCSAAVGDLLSPLQERGVPANLLFSPTEFVLAGEKPFLTSYRNRLRRFIVGVDIEDARFDGTPTPLGRGNGEIKEMVSILRCFGFDGWMVLGRGNARCGSLLDAAEGFERLLECM